MPSCSVPKGSAAAVLHKQRHLFWTDFRRGDITEREPDATVVRRTGWCRRKAGGLRCHPPLPVLLLAATTTTPKTKANLSSVRHVKDGHGRLKVLGVRVKHRDIKSRKPYEVGGRIAPDR